MIFEIQENKLYAISQFDFEDKNKYVVEVDVISSGYNLTDTVNIYVKDMPDQLDDILISNDSVKFINQGSFVGTLIGDDQHICLYS